MDTNELGSITRPNGTNVSTNAVGLLNIYEYQSSNNGGIDGYLNNELQWWTLTPYTSNLHIRLIDTDGDETIPTTITFFNGIRPSINLKSSIKIVEGNGTVNNPYRLNGNNDSNLSGTLLNTRYSGEYIRFGTGENNLYRIVSHETEGLTKITSAEPLKDNGEFKELAFDSNNNANYSSTNTIGIFLNGEYLTNYVGSPYIDMIEESTTWYLGTVGSGSSYKLAKYTDVNGTILTSSTTNSKVGLLRLGELMAGQFDRYGNNTYYWTLTPYSTSNVRNVSNHGNAGSSGTLLVNGIRPSLNLKSNVIITGGLGTKEQPFEIALQ